MLITLKIIFNFLLNYVWFVNIFFILIIILIERKNPLYTLFWIFLLTIIPYLGFTFYLFFGISFRKRRKANTIYSLKLLKSSKKISLSNRNDLKKWESLMTYLEMSSKNSISLNNNFEIFNEGQDFYNSLKKEIQNAKETIFMEYYIFQMDKIGKEILDLLIKKANEGLSVVLITDGINNANRKIRKYLKNSQVSYLIFFKHLFPHLNLYANYRNHRKICIIDKTISYVGGMNIGDEYRSLGKIGYWKDLSVKIIGDISTHLEKEFYFSLSLSKSILNKDKIFQKFNYDIENSKEQLLARNKFYTSCQIVSSGPNYEFRTMRDNFLKLIQEAKKSILIQTPYFIPDDYLLDALKVASLSGVNVKIMIPKKADHFIAGCATQYYIRDLVELGIKVYRYEKGFLHSKVLIIDEEVASIGTANFDYRSMYLNFELNLNIYEKEIAKILSANFYKDTLSSSIFTVNDYNNKSIIKKILNSIFRLLAPIL